MFDPGSVETPDKVEAFYLHHDPQPSALYEHSSATFPAGGQQSISPPSLALELLNLMWLVNLQSTASSLIKSVPLSGQTSQLSSTEVSLSSWFL